MSHQVFINGTEGKVIQFKGTKKECKSWCRKSKKPYSGIEPVPHVHHTVLSDFNWQSDLFEERKKEIIAWVDSLSDNEKMMIHEIVQDVEQETHDANDSDL